MLARFTLGLGWSLVLDLHCMHAYGLHIKAPGLVPHMDDDARIGTVYVTVLLYVYGVVVDS